METRGGVQFEGARKLRIWQICFGVIFFSLVYRVQETSKQISPRKVSAIATSASAPEEPRNVSHLVNRIDVPTERECSFILSPRSLKSGCISEFPFECGWSLDSISTSIASRRIAAAIGGGAADADQSHAQRLDRLTAMYDRADPALHAVGIVQPWKLPHLASASLLTAASEVLSISSSSPAPSALSDVRLYHTALGDTIAKHAWSLCPYQSALMLQRSGVGDPSCVALLLLVLLLAPLLAAQRERDSH